MTDTHENKRIPVCEVCNRESEDRFCSKQCYENSEDYALAQQSENERNAVEDREE